MKDNPVYMCKDCLKNKQTKRKTFYTLNLPNPDNYKNQCLTCGSLYVIKLNLTNDETERLINSNCDMDTILKMNELKNEDYNSFIFKFHRFEEIQHKKDYEWQKRKIELKKQGNTYPLKPQYAPKCPTCGSPNIKKISGIKRWVGTGLFGLASSDIGKTMQCENCGYKW